MKRTLSLKREPLIELSPEDLLAVAGGARPTTPIDYCVDQQNTQVICFTAAMGASRCLCPTEA